MLKTKEIQSGHLNVENSIFLRLSEKLVIKMRRLLFTDANYYNLNKPDNGYRKKRDNYPQRLIL